MTNKTINFRINFITYIIIFSFSIIFIKLFYLTIIKNNYYKTKLEMVTSNTIYGESVPRGRIYDRNMNLLVDNKEVRIIYYSKPNNVTFEEEYLLALEVSKILVLDYDSISIYNMKRFFILKYKDIADSYITKLEWEKYNNRLLSSDDIYNLKLERITSDDLEVFSFEDKRAIYLYYLMNDGYYYEEKVIKNNASYSEYAFVAENAYLLKGFNTKLSWERDYLYGDCLRGILGDISTIPYELKDYYLSLGYSLDDRVGVTGIEYTYESYLKGEKSLYRIGDDNKLSLVKEGIRGNDLVLTIDINIQKEIEEVLISKLKNKNKYINTEYYDHSWVVIQEVATGDVVALASKKMVFDNGNYKIYDNSSLVNKETITPGSIVKVASMIVGYNTNAVSYGMVINDKCISLGSYKKCSWKNLGKVNDLEALKYSSNVYQYRTALKVANLTGFDQASWKSFNTYRSIFYQFGLGSITGLDVPNEITGYKGNDTALVQLMDFAIGQYDTYTPIQISQYINTVATSGIRVVPHLLKEVYKGSNNKEIGELIYKYEPVILNKVSTNDSNFERVKKGLKMVVNGGTGVGYVDKKYDFSGKTGTSESFIDTNNDNKIDQETYTKNFIAYAPSTNPIMSIYVGSPNISSTKKGDYIANINKDITLMSTRIFFKYYHE